jgi:hypothetical protein
MPSAGEIAKSVMRGNGEFCAPHLLANLAQPGGTPAFFPGYTSPSALLPEDILLVRILGAFSC